MKISFVNALSCRSYICTLSSSVISVKIVNIIEEVELHITRTTVRPVYFTWKNVSITFAQEDRQFTSQQHVNLQQKCLNGAWGTNCQGHRDRMYGKVECNGNHYILLGIKSGHVLVSGAKTCLMFQNSGIIKESKTFACFRFNSPERNIECKVTCQQKSCY